MPILPEGFALPPGPYLVGLLVAIAGVVVLLHRRRPPVTEGTVAALAPWMAAGGTMYATFQAGLVPSMLAPLFGSPAVYVTVGILAGLVWAAVADRPGEGWRADTAPGVLGLVGAALLVVVVVGAFGAAARGGDVRPGISVLILVATVVVTAAAWLGVQRAAEVSAAGLVGLLTVFGHTLDGVSTAVGYDLLGFGEQVPLSRLIIEFGASLPTAAYVGGAWLFVVVKVVLAVVIVVLFEEYVREQPTEGYLLLGFVAAVGFGPGAHNLVLFAIA